MRPKKFTLSQSFQFFGAAGANPRWSWSAKSPNGEVVVITFWADGIRVADGAIAYDSFDLEGSGAWIHLPGNRERIRNLRWAIDHCDGRVRAVITVAEDVNAIPRRIRERFPLPGVWMQVSELNDETGEFRARMITAA